MLGIGNGIPSTGNGNPTYVRYVSEDENSERWAVEIFGECGKKSLNLMEDVRIVASLDVNLDVSRDMCISHVDKSLQV